MTISRPIFDIREHEPLARYTSWRIGGPARFFCETSTPESLAAALTWANERGVRVFVLGGGTNTLALDGGFDGLVLRYRDLSVTLAPTNGGATVRLGAGAPTAGTVRKLARQGYAGLEWAEGLPGTIGGAVYGNAGCYGGDIAGMLRRAWLLHDGAVEEWPLEHFGYGYRTSILKSGFASKPIVLAAEIDLRTGDPAELAERMAVTSATRRSKTPGGQSCGSVFKNPPGDSSGRLIEAAGLKGHRIGGAQIASEHANYIVNRGGASSDDVLRLIDVARSEVLRQFGVELHLEVQLLGAAGNE